MAFNVSYVYQILDKYSGPINKITRETEKYQRTVRKAQVNVKGLETRLNRAGQSMANFRSVLGAVGGVAGLGLVINQASKMQDAMGDVQRVFEFQSKKTLAIFKDDIDDLAVRMGRGSESIAGMVFQAGKLGIARDKALAFVEIAAKTGTALELTDAEASRALGSIRDKVGITVADLVTMTDSINFLADSTSASGNQMIEIIERVSGTVATLKMAPKDIAGWSAFSNIIETSPELAASGFRMMIQRMKKIKGLGPKLYAAPNQTIKEILTSISAMDKMKQAKFIQKFFGEEAGKFVEKAVNKINLLDSTLEKARSAKAAGSIDKEFQKISERLSFIISQTKALGDQVSESIGKSVLGDTEGLAKSLNLILKRVKTFVDTNPKLVKTGVIILAIFTALAAIVVPLGIIVASLGALMPLISGISAAFLVLSGPVGVAILGVGALLALFYDMGALPAIWEGLKGTLMILVNIFKILLNTVVSTFEFVWKLFSLDFSGAFDSLAKGGKNIIRNFSDILGTFSKVPGISQENLFGAGAAQEKARSTAMANSLNVQGDIKVSADEGSKVVYSKLALDTGYQL